MPGSIGSPPPEAGRPRAAPGLGLVLTGGGARTAYQVGALLAISEWLGRPRRSPFSIITGTSAGAINASVLAARARSFARGLEGLAGVWHNLRVGDVVRCDHRALYGRAVRWLAALVAGGLGRHNPRSLLDCRPLRALLERHVNFARIELHLRRGALDALAVTASGYGSSRGVTFYQAAGHPPPWQRERTLSCPAELTLDHVMASVAIPLLFEAVRLDDDWYGDGAMRDHAPLSAAINLGAERLLVLTTRNNDPVPLPQVPPYPTLGKIGGYVLDSLFMDAVGANLERLRGLNELVQRAGSEPPQRFGRPLRHIDACLLAPSVDLREIAARHSGRFPTLLRRLLRGIGAFGALSPLPSYLLFDGAFCSELMDLGYADAQRQRDAIIATVLGSGITI